jgi:hypothetical protein
MVVAKLDHAHGVSLMAAYSRPVERLNQQRETESAAPESAPAVPVQAAPLSPPAIRTLQRTAGNAAVVRVLRERRLMRVGEDAPEPTKRRIDIIVSFIGSDRESQLQEDDVYPDDMLREYRARDLRSVKRFGHRTKTIRSESASLLDGYFSKIKAAFAQGEQGEIFIYGSSSGGRNAMDLAAKLSGQGIPVSFVAALDAAWFPDEAKNKPDSEPEPTTLPQFPSPGDSGAGDRHNYFQTYGNKAKSTWRHGLLWTSTMAGEEVHGEVDGYVSHDFTRAVKEKIEAEGRPSADAAHVDLAKLAKPDVRFRIQQRLIRLM